MTWAWPVHARIFAASPSLTATTPAAPGERRALEPRDLAVLERHVRPSRRRPRSAARYRAQMSLSTLWAETTTGSSRPPGTFATSGVHSTWTTSGRCAATSSATFARTAASRCPMTMYGTRMGTLRRRSHAKRTPCFTSGRRGTTTTRIPAASTSATPGGGRSAGTTSVTSWSRATRRRSSNVRMRFPESVGNGSASSIASTLTARSPRG